jgi:cytidylate kinase
MSERILLTIGRQFGSGGREIAFKLAEKLGIKCYDKELIYEAAKESGLAETIIETHDEKPTSSFLYSLVMDFYTLGANYPNLVDVPINQKAFLAQFDAIKKISKRESCIIVGRCADYILENDPHLISVFIHAPLDIRINRIAERFNIGPDKAKDLIHKTDKNRESYYNYYSNRKWSDINNYHLTIDSGKLDVEQCAEVIYQYISLKEIRAKN